jgi:hypothetical protein
MVRTYESRSNGPSSQATWSLMPFGAGLLEYIPQTTVRTPACDHIKVVVAWWLATSQPYLFFRYAPIAGALGFTSGPK